MSAMSICSIDLDKSSTENGMLQQEQKFVLKWQEIRKKRIT